MGSGKTTLAKKLQKKIPAAHIVEVDALAHKLYQSSTIKQKLFTIFGKSIFSALQEVNRKKLLKALLKNSKKWDRLEHFLHPLMKSMLCECILRAKRKETVIIPCALPHIFFPELPITQHIHLSGKREILFQRLKKTRKMSRPIFMALWNRAHRYQHFAPLVRRGVG